MSITSLFRIGMRAAEAATPHVKKWHLDKHFNRTEGQRHLHARNYAEAERHLTAALDEKHSRKHRSEISGQPRKDAGQAESIG
jgi:hypothetical protein